LLKKEERAAYPWATFETASTIDNCGPVCGRLRRLTWNGGGGSDRNRRPPPRDNRRFGLLPFFDRG
jgi:hypothetical protein